MDPQKTPPNKSTDGDGVSDPAVTTPETSPPEATIHSPAQPDPMGSSPPTVQSAPENVGPDAEVQPQADSSAPADLTPANENTQPVTGDVVPDPLPVAAPKHRKKGLIMGLVIAAILLLLSGGAAASYYYMLNQPENVLKQALANSMDAEKTKTARFSGAVSAEQSGSDTPLAATFKGSADSQTGAFEFSGKVDLLIANVSFDLLSEDSKSLFFRLGGLEGLPELLAASNEQAAPYAPIISSLNDQWIEVNESLIKQYDESYESGVLTEADIQKVTDAYLKHSFLVIDKVLEDQVIAGDNCYHYRLKVDSSKLKDFVTALKDAKLDSYKIDQKAVDAFKKSIDEAGLDKYPIEIWISKGGKMIRQAATEFATEGMNLSVRFTVDSYNQAVDIKKPDDAKSLLDIMGGLLGGGLAPAAELESGISL